MTNERYSGGDRPPQLSEAEINLLITRVMIDDNDPKEAIDADLQVADHPKPYFYSLEIDPVLVQEHMDEQEKYSEEITSVALDYTDERITRRDGRLLPARLRVFIESTIRDHLAPDLTYHKDVTYTLLLQPDAQWDVIETYYDDQEAPLDDDRVKSGQEKADGIRKLNEDDVAILKLLV